jgi:multiple sugar transport system permease protein
MTTSTSKLTRSAGFHTTAAALAVLFLFPLVWSGWSSVKGQPGSSQASGYGFANYGYLASYGEGLVTYVTNTAAVTTMTVVGTLVVSALGGYGFARFDFPGKNLLFLATLAILMVPYATILIPRCTCCWTGSACRTPWSASAWCSSCSSCRSRCS